MRIWKAVVALIVRIVSVTTFSAVEKYGRPFVCTSYLSLTEFHVGMRTTWTSLLYPCTSSKSFLGNFLNVTLLFALQ